MPINVPYNLPARKVLQKENVFVIGQGKARHQDIRALKIGILNLMPVKITTEMQQLRMLSNTPLQLEIEFIKTATHDSKHTPEKHMKEFYKTFAEVKRERFDGLIITGAPIERLEFEQVDYWNEMKEILKWADKNVTSTLYLCWAAQAALYYHYRIPKYNVGKKLIGVFPHTAVNPKAPLLRGFDDMYLVPHARFTGTREKDIKKIKELEILSVSKEAGVHITATKNGRKIFISGHSEYDPFTLKDEFVRDTKLGLPIDIPKNYFPDDNPKLNPVVNWRSHGFLLYSNWLNYYVYQTTPYNWVNAKR